MSAYFHDRAGMAPKAQLTRARGLLMVREVAKLLGRSPFSICRMAEKRQISSLTIGGSRCFDPSALALWLSKKEPSLAAAARWLKMT